MSCKLKNIIIVCDYAYIEGGASRVAQESAIALADKYNVILFAAVGGVSKEMENSKVKVHCLEQKDILHNGNRIQAVIQGIWNRKARMEFREVLRGHAPEETVVHVHTWTKGISSAIFNEAEKLGFKVLLTVHDYFLVCPNGGLFNYQKHRICELEPLSCKCICTNCDSRRYMHKLFRILRQLIQNIAIRRRNNVFYVFISEFAKEQLLRRKPKIEKSFYLENPINFVNRFKVNCKDNAVYLYVGRLTDDKGIRVFCDAVTKANVSATVIGVGNLETELKEQYNNIYFAGWVEKKDMFQYIEKARCLIFPSVYYEVSPLTPLELMACGVPCIVSDKNSSRELIREGVNGFLYDGYSVDDLVKAIEKSKDSKLIDAMSQNIYRTFEVDKYSMEEHLSKLVDIYESVLNNQISL